MSTLPTRALVVVAGISAMLACGGGGGSSAPAPLPAPTVGSVSPANGPVGTQVTVTGTNLLGTTAVRFNGISAPTFNVASATSLSAVVPAGATSGLVSVTTPGGTASSASAFTVTIPSGTLATITNFSPTSGYTGQTVSITGSHFTGTTSVTFGGRPTLFQVVNDTLIQATPPSDGTTGPLGVVNSAGTATSTSSFTMQPLSADLVLAGGFEDSGAGCWTSVADSPTYRQVQANAHGGSWYVIFLGNTSTFTDEMYQDIAIPAVSAAPVLSYWTRITANSTSDPTDTFKVEIRDTSNTVLATLATYTPANATSTWVNHTADLSAYKGLTIRLAFKAKEKAVGGTSFRLDDVSLPVTLPGVASTPFDVSLASAYVVQATQKPDNSVPLVAGRDGWVRVFATANQPNVAQPPVQVTFKNGTTTLGVLTIPSASAGVPTTVNQGFANLCYMAQVPGAWLQAGTTLTAVLDPNGTLLENSTANNTLGATLDVRTVPDFKLTLFAVTSPSGTGNVSDTNLSDWMDRFKRIYPVKTLDVQFGGGFSTTADLETGSAGTGDDWATCAAELEAKRQTDGMAAQRYYAGAVKVAYSSGIAGIANSIPMPSTTTGRTCIAWDKTGYSDGGNYPEVLAHELGHTLGRHHSPCGGAGGPDLNYPYALADIGVYGIDTETGTIKSPRGQTDIMGYCSPIWISDYVFKKVLDFRATSAVGKVVAPEAEAAAEPCLLVMGVMNNGILDLKPAFALDSHPALPAAGPYTLEGLDAQGRVLVTQAFDMQDLEDGPEKVDLKSFVFTLPLAADKAAALASLRVRKADQVLALKTRTAPSLQGQALGIAQREPVATRLSGETVYLSWDASRHPLALLRDASTGAMLGFAKGGGATLRTRAKGLQIVLSDGIGGTAAQAQVLD